MINRRDSLFTFTGVGLSLAMPRALHAQSSPTLALDPYAKMQWGKGFEGQRKADLGNGHYLNPIFAGDHPDPSILHDGDDYYLTFSSFDAYPGIVIWHSRDLVNWQPVTAALSQPIGSVWAPCLAKHGSTYYCYIPTHGPKRSIYVISAPDIHGPWSAPIDLHLPNHIDPDHFTDGDGKRWLFLSGGDRVALSDDGLSTIGAPEHIYDPWHYPEDWDAESFSPEGPKLAKRGKYYYMTTAVGGTAGPPTGHMVIAARSKSLTGPWENCPANPLIHTKSAREKWWSRGHATLFEGPNGKWWFLYHGYENGYWTLGRQALLEPVEWTHDGWPKPMGDDLSKPILKPLSLNGQQHGQPLSDDFSTDKLGIEWAFYDPEANEVNRLRREGGTLHMAAKGTSPSDCSPLACNAGDQAYKITVDIDIDEGAEGGMLLFYNRRLYAGLGLNAHDMTMQRYGLQRNRAKPVGMARSMRLRLTNDHHILTIHTSLDEGKNWHKFEVQMEVSGYHHNVAYDFLSLRPALYAAGKGEVRFRNFIYEAL